MSSIHPGRYAGPSGLGHADVCPAIHGDHDCPDCGRQASDYRAKEDPKG